MKEMIEYDKKKETNFYKSEKKKRIVKSIKFP